MLQDVELDYTQNELLRKTFYGHEINLRNCVKISSGWLCVFLFCYVPWIVACFILLERNQTSTAACDNDERGFILCVSSCLLSSALARGKLNTDGLTKQNVQLARRGFVVFFVVNCCVNWAVSCVKSVDRGALWCVPNFRLMSLKKS